MLWCYLRSHENLFEHVLWSSILYRCHNICVNKNHLPFTVFPLVNLKPTHFCFYLFLFFRRKKIFSWNTSQEEKKGCEFPRGSIMFRAVELTTVKAAMHPNYIKPGIKQRESYESTWVRLLHFPREYLHCFLFVLIHVRVHFREITDLCPLTN